jgi:hypothetical protein
MWFAALPDYWDSEIALQVAAVFAAGYGVFRVVQRIVPAMRVCTACRQLTLGKDPVVAAPDVPALQCNDCKTRYVVVDDVLLDRDTFDAGALCRGIAEARVVRR